jgi:hypothetical protein
LAFSVCRRASNVSKPSRMFVTAALGVGHEGAHVGMAWDVGPVLGENLAAEGVKLALPQNSQTRSFESKVEPSDPCEEASNGQRSHLMRSL